MPFATHVLSHEVVWKVVDISADPVPSNLLLIASLQTRVAQHLHAVIVQRVWLGQVKYVELDCLALSNVAGSEEEPLSMSVSVDVVLQDEVIFTVTHFDRCQQIACFKP